jgi:hypothetical protein
MRRSRSAQSPTRAPAHRLCAAHDHSALSRRLGPEDHFYGFLAVAHIVGRCRHGDAPSESLWNQDARLPASDMQRSLLRKARICDIAMLWDMARHGASRLGNVPPLGNGPARQGAQVSTIHSKPTTDRSITVSQSLLTGSGFGLVAPASVPFSIFISRIAEMRRWASPAMSARWRAKFSLACPLPP